VPEALICEPGYSGCKETWAPSDHERTKRAFSADVTGRRPYPAVQPGQLWLIEIPPTDPGLAPLEYRVIAAADLVIYDRALASTIAKVLPLCGYAEPAGPYDAVPERCVRLVIDGWSVARLIIPGSSNQERSDEFRCFAEWLLALKTAADLPILAFTNAGGGLYQRGTTAGEHPLAQLSKRTIVFSAIESGAGPLFCFASANGLAG
jgi:hypothetical protein